MSNGTRRLLAVVRRQVRACLIADKFGREDVNVNHKDTTIKSIAAAVLLTLLLMATAVGTVIYVTHNEKNE